MHPLGVHTHLFRGAPAAVSQACRAAGLDCVQLTPAFPGLLFRDPAQITASRCQQAAEPFQEAGLQIAALACSSNLLNPDLARRHEAIVRLHALLRHCRDFGTTGLVSETGSLSPDAIADPDAPTQSIEAWTELRIILAECLRIADDHGVTLMLRARAGQAVASAADAL